MIVEMRNNCELCDIQEFLKGQTWKIFLDEEFIVNYAKEPCVDGHLVVQPKRHIKRITELCPSEWVRLSKLLYQYSQAVEKALNKRAKGKDEVERVFLWCFCSPPYEHLHFHIKPRMKSIEKEGTKFVDYSDPQTRPSKESMMNIMKEIREFLCKPNILHE